MKKGCLKRGLQRYQREHFHIHFLLLHFHLVQSPSKYVSMSLDDTFPNPIPVNPPVLLLELKLSVQQVSELQIRAQRKVFRAVCYSLKVKMQHGCMNLLLITSISPRLFLSVGLVSQLTVVLLFCTFSKEL